MRGAVLRTSMLKPLFCLLRCLGKPSTSNIQNVIANMTKALWLRCSKNQMIASHPAALILVCAVVAACNIYRLIHNACINKQYYSNIFNIRQIVSQKRLWNRCLRMRGNIAVVRAYQYVLSLKKMQYWWGFVSVVRVLLQSSMPAKFCILRLDEK